MRRLIFLVMQCCVVRSTICPKDMNRDHRLRVSCAGRNLMAVPDGIPPDTQVLVLRQNNFSSLSWSSYSGFAQLHELDLSHNRISTLEPPGPVLGNLSVLRLSGNRLTGLGGLVFRCAPNLMEIFLDNNQIRSLHDATFSELPRLEIINLSRNKLPALPSRLLERVSSSGLKTFDLENNSVSLMPDGFFSSKPELPYVYLSHNPWLCSCAVGYLHSFLNDQEHNIYQHGGPNDIIPAADTVVCSRPAHLFQRPIIELEENDFCPPDPPLYPSGDVDFQTRSPGISVKPNPTPQSKTAPHDTTTISDLPASTKTWSPNWSWVKLEGQGLNFSLGPFTITKLVADIPSRATTESHTASESPNTGPSTARSQGQSTGQLDPYTSRTTITVHTKPPTVGPITTRSQRQSTIPREPHTSRTTIAARTEVPTAERFTARPEPPTSVGPNWADARDVDGGMRPWCWWLFAGFVLLCVLSALTSCSLFLWLLRNYLTLNRRLKRHGSARSASDGVLLREYRCAENTQTSQKEGESVSSLALEQIKDVQAVFRSVLFINQKEEQCQTREMKGRDASKIEELPVADEVGDKGREPKMSGDVYRKTLYRVISHEEEADGWREEEERWVRSREGTTARYSLILREERGRQQWVVGEWELGDGGVAYQRSCSLIGQSSSVALE